MPAATQAPPAAPAAPAKATPAPAPAAAPPKADAKPLPTERPMDDWMGDVGADLDRLSEEDDAKAEGRQPRKPAAPEREIKPPEGERAPDKEPKEPAPEKPSEVPEPTKLNDLRSAYSNLKKKVKEEYEPKLQSLEAKVKEFETSNPPEVKVLQERLQAAEKRRDELEQHIQYVDYAKSKDFADKYERPYKEAWRDALADLEELEVEVEGGNVRKATEKDLVELANLPLGEARRRANAMFGDSADDVMLHRRKIIDLAHAQNKALEDARTKSAERATMTETERRSADEKRIRLWTENNQAITQKWPKMFAPVEGDKEGNDLLTKGEAMADRLFRRNEQNAPKTPEEEVRLHAMIYQKVRNHDRLALWLKKANAKIKELETSLEQYEKSDPNGGLAGGAPSAGNGKSWMGDAEAELDALDKKGA